MSAPPLDGEPPIEVVTVGEAMRLLVAEPGVALRRATRFHSSVAGAESNVAVGLARLGHRVRWLGRLGADPAGDAVLAFLRAEGVDVSRVERDPAAYTGLLMRDSHPGRGIDVQYYRAGSAAAGMSREFVRDRDLDGARLVHVSGITPMLSASARDATEALLDVADRLGVVVAFDPNVRRKLGPPEAWRAVACPLMKRADLVFTGADELELITGQGRERAAAELLGGRAQAVLIKENDKSCRVLTADGDWRRPALAVVAVDPVGAGDAMVSGYLSAWLRGAAPPAALLSGAVSAALVVGAVTDTEGLPDRREHERARSAFLGGQEEVDR